jgi:hypothetical protein
MAAGFVLPASVRRSNKNSLNSLSCNELRLPLRRLVEASMRFCLSGYCSHRGARRGAKIVMRFASCLAMIAAVTSAPSAQDASAPLRLELNRLEPQGESCRTYLLIDNRKGKAVKALKIDLFALDTEGVAQRRIAIELGPFPANKTLIKLFDFNLACQRFGRVLLNGVLTCEDESGASEDCLSRIETASKVAAVSFDK